MKTLRTTLISIFAVLVILALLSRCQGGCRRPHEPAVADTVYVHHTDTIVHVIHDTISSATQEEINQLPRCEEGGDGVINSSSMRVERSFNMGRNHGTFTLEWETYGIPDQIMVYNCLPREISQNKPIFDTGMVATSRIHYNRITFGNGPVITVVGVTGSTSGSSWNFTVHCPD